MTHIIGGEKSHVGMANCYFCGEPSMVLLDTRIVKGELKKSLPRDCGVVDMEPCSKCKKLMEAGVILITVKSDSFEEVEKDRQEFLADSSNYEAGSGSLKKPFIPNPYRTGGWFVVRDEMLERMREDVPDAVIDRLLGMRWGFISHEDAEALGLFQAEPVHKTVEQCIQQNNVQEDNSSSGLILPD
jgi:hypothetical protein